MTKTDGRRATVGSGGGSVLRCTRSLRLGPEPGAARAHAGRGLAGSGRALRRAAGHSSGRAGASCTRSRAERVRAGDDWEAVATCRMGSVRGRLLGPPIFLERALALSFSLSLESFETTLEGSSGPAPRRPPLSGRTEFALEANTGRAREGKRGRRRFPRSRRRQPRRQSRRQSRRQPRRQPCRDCPGLGGRTAAQRAPGSHRRGTQAAPITGAAGSLTLFLSSSARGPEGWDLFY